MTTHHSAPAGGLSRKILPSALFAALAAASAPAQAQPPHANLDGRANLPADLRLSPVPEPPAAAPAPGGAPSSSRPAASPEKRSTRTAPAPFKRDPIEDLPIAPGGKTKGLSLGILGDRSETSPARRSSTSGLLWKSISGLIVVLALILVGVVVLRRVLPGARGMGESSALTVIGRTYLAPKSALFLVKVGRRILVVGNTPGGLTRVAEIDDPDEVERVCARCEQARANSMTASFRRLLAEGVAGHRELEGAEEPDESPAGRDLGSADKGTPDGALSRSQADANPLDEGAETEVGLVRQELDLILGKVRSWREGRVPSGESADT